MIASIRLPKQYRFQGKEVFIKHMGNAVLILPQDNPWELFIQSLSEFSADFHDFMDERKLSVRGHRQ